MCVLLFTNESLCIITEKNTIIVALSCIVLKYKISCLCKSAQYSYIYIYIYMMKKIQLCMVLKVSCLAAIISHEIQNKNIIKPLQNYCGMCSDIKIKRKKFFFFFLSSHQCQIGKAEICFCVCIWKPFRFFCSVGFHVCTL